MKFVLILVSIIIVSVNSPVSACGYDGQFNNPFTVAYPGSLGVALATRAALKNKSIPQIPVLSGKEGLERSFRWLGQMRDRLDSREFHGEVFILLVDSGLWSRIGDSDKSIAMATSLLESSQRLQLETHSETPREPNKNVAILIASEAAFSALVADIITLDQAISLGVVRLSVDHSKVNYWSK